MFATDIRIIIIDDMVTMRKIVKKSLLNIGYTNVTEANDAAVALPLIKTASESGLPFGLIISDWNMPGMLGIDLLQAVRNDPALKDTPFILLTAENENEQIKKAISLDIDGYVIKPFTPQRLKETIQKAYDKKMKRAQSS